MWVPLVENNECGTPGADYFVKKHIDHILSADPAIDTLILACTHYPLLMDAIKKFLPPGVTLFAQGERVGESLAGYLQRHSEMDKRLSKQGVRRFLTTESPDKFTQTASLFLKRSIRVEQIALD
jgi:glutamate racemase